MTGAREGAHAGYTLAEATLALLLAGILLACLVGILSIVGRLGSRHERVAIEAETERVVAAILGAELRPLTRADARFDSDSVRLRAFRGTGIVCAGGDREVTVRYWGVRVPEPDKDSVLLMWPTGERAYALRGIGSQSSCSGSRDGALRLLIEADVVQPSPPAVALVFETGAYSISGSAFRYRRGAGGRQPLTETVLSDAASGLTLTELEGTPATAAVVGLLPSGSRVPGLSESASSSLGLWLVMPQGGMRPGATEP